MARRKLEVVIVGESKGLSTALRKSSGDLTAFGKATTKTKGHVGGIFRSVGGLTTALIGGAGLVGGLKAVSGAYAESQVSGAKMQAQLKASGISFADHAKQIDKSIQATSQLSGLDDEDLQDSFTNIVRVTGDVNKSLKLNALAADIARAKHMEVAKAGELVGKVAGGNTGILARYGIVIKKGSTATEALAQLQGKFAGQARAYGATQAGATNRFKVAVENLEEKIGKALAPTIASAANSAAKFVNQMTSGTGAGGRFAAKMKELWNQVQPIAAGFLHISMAVGQFVAKHPALIKVAAALVAIEVARKAIRWADSVTGVSNLISKIASLKTRSAEAEGAGSTLGKTFASKMGLAAAAGIAGWEIGSWIRKHVPAVRSAADTVARAFGKAFGTASSAAQDFDNKMAKITGDVQKAAQAFRNATNPVDKNTAAIKLHVIAAQASVAQLKKNRDAIGATGIAAVDGAAKTAKLKAANDALKQAEQEAASWAATLKNNLDALPASKTITVQINTSRSGGGGAFGLNKPARKAHGSSVAHSAGLPPFFTEESDLASLQSLRDTTQTGFDTADQAARRRQDIHDSHLKGKDNASTRKSALADLKALNQEIARAKTLGKIDLQIKGKEQAIAFKNAIADIRKQLHDAARSAADAFRSMREKQINDAHDATISQINDSADAHELASLQKEDKDKQDAKTEKDLNKALADAIASGDKEAQQQAQDDIDAYKRQKREEELQANLDAAKQKADDDQTTALSGLDQEVADFQSALDKKLQDEADQLSNRKENYATFLADLQKIADGYGLNVSDLIAASPDQEAAINAPVVTGGTVQSGGKKHKGRGKGKHRAMGGPVRAGESYIVGERGQEVFVPGQNGTIVPNNRLGAYGTGGAYVHVDKMEIRNTTDVQRWASRLAFTLKTA